MKLSVIGLFALGVIAAVCAAVLVASLKTELTPQAAEEEVVAEEIPLVQVLVASMDMAPMTVLDSEGVEIREVEATAVPESHFSDPVQVVGKILVVPVKAGQAFEESLFASENSGLQLASALAEGKRAVNVALSDPMGMEFLLYPGSTVDVLATVKTLKNDSEAEETVSVTLLQDIIVLAVGRKSVVDPVEEGEDDDFVVRKADRPTVTLLVDPDQAEILKLAMHMGSVSLTMRNPMDEGRTDFDGKRVTELSPILAERDKAARLKAQRDQERRDLIASFEVERATFDREREQAKIEIDRLRFEQQKLEAEKARLEALTPTWQATVIRGGVSETREFKQTVSPHRQ